MLARNQHIWEIIILIEPFIILLFLSLATFGAARLALPAFPALAIFASVGLETILRGGTDWHYKKDKIRISS